MKKTYIKDFIIGALLIILAFQVASFQSLNNLGLLLGFVLLIAGMVIVWEGIKARRLYRATESRGTNMKTTTDTVITHGSQFTNASDVAKRSTASALAAVQRVHPDINLDDCACSSLEDCIEFTIQKSSISVSDLQRGLKLGYSAAARYMDEMYDLDIIGEYARDGQRDILISFEDWPGLSEYKHIHPGKQAAAEKAFFSILDAIPSAHIQLSEKPSNKLNISQLNEIKYSTTTRRTDIEKLGNFVVIDVETTGLDVRHDEIVEIGAIRFRGFEPVDKFETLCKPKRGITEKSVQVHGITDEMVAEKNEFEFIAASLQSYIGKDNLVGHNLPFDLRFIVKYGVDVGAEKRKYYDTLNIARNTLGPRGKVVENYKLQTLTKYYNIPHYNTHRSLADCYATAMLLRKLAIDRL